MNIKKILLWTSIASLIIYNGVNRKIGPCSPELELILNKKSNS